MENQSRAQETAELRRKALADLRTEYLGEIANAAAVHREKVSSLDALIDLDNEELEYVLANQAPVSLGRPLPTQQPRQRRGAQNFLTALNIAALLLLGFLLFTPRLPDFATSLYPNVSIDQTPNVNMSSTEQT